MQLLFEYLGKKLQKVEFHFIYFGPTVFTAHAYLIFIIKNSKSYVESYADMDLEYK
jgi:hypothetical protein